MLKLKKQLLATKLFIDNEYLDKYVALLCANLSTSAQKRRTQRHHIIPRAYYKLMNTAVDNSDSNLVNLLYKDHVLAHYFLACCSRSDDLKYANMLAIQNITGHKFSDVKLDELKLENFQEMYEQAMKHQAAQASYHHKGRKHSEEHVQKISESLKGRVCVNNGLVNKYINIEEIDNYLSNGWVRGSRWTPPTEWCEDIRRRKTGTKMSEESKQKIKDARKLQSLNGEPAYGHKMSEESKQQMIQKLKLRCVVNNGVDELSILKSELNDYLEKGYIRGRLLRLWVNDGVHNKQVLVKDVACYLDNNWVRGKIKKNKENAE